MTDATEDDAGFQEVWSLFRMDARSDAALAGLDMCSFDSDTKMAMKVSL